MNPQEQNKPKAPFQNPPLNAPGDLRKDDSAATVAANIQPGGQDKNRKDTTTGKPADKDDGTCSPDKDTCAAK